jgi:hypothetical protein
MNEQGNQVPLTPSEEQQEKQIDLIIARAVALAGEFFPKGKLKNRLLNLGLEEFVEGVGDPKKPRIQISGFPFKFTNQLDEAILALAHFLDRFKDEGGTLEVYALNRLTKGEERDLSYWNDAKAKLYLELQNIILLLNGVPGPMRNRVSSVKRVFTFTGLSDLAFITQAGINVLGEQLAAGVEVGAIFLDKLDKELRARMEPLSNTLLVKFEPDLKEEAKHNFYELFGLGDETGRSVMPYSEECVARWYKTEEDAVRQSPGPRLETLLKLIRGSDQWETLDNAHTVCRLGKKPEEFFNLATNLMYEAFDASKIKRGFDDPSEFIVKRINRTVITRDMIRLQRAMSNFSQAERLWAVDATSVKNSLKIHEARPTYRDWLRRSLNRVLQSNSKELRRVYILKDHENDSDDEYQTLQRLLQYYLDYFHYEISGMSKIVHRHEDKEFFMHRGSFFRHEWFKKRWASFPERVGIYVTTTKVLKEFADRVLSEGGYTGSFTDILPNEKSNLPKNEYLMKLDYLFTEEMIYNFRNPRADTDELQFPAEVFRESVNVSLEKDTLFNFTDNNELKKLQTPYRLYLLALSLQQYEKNYSRMLKGRRGEDEGSVEEILDAIKDKLEEAKPIFDEERIEEFIDIRAAFEGKLYKHFIPHFDYLFHVLKCQSVRVKFWGDEESPDFPETFETDIRKIHPFGCADAESFSEFVKKTVPEQWRDGREVIPKFQDFVNRHASPTEVWQPKEDKVVDNQPGVFLNYSRQDADKVELLYQRLRETEFKPWMDVHDILPGRDWPRELKRAAKKSPFFIACLSESSVNRRGYVQVELKEALENRSQLLPDDISLIPVRLDDCLVPEDLEQFQYQDLFVDDVWNEAGWNRLLQALRTGWAERQGSPS